jgi:hypothetical protein
LYHDYVAHAKNVFFFFVGDTSTISTAGRI